MLVDKVYSYDSQCFAPKKEKKKRCARSKITWIFKPWFGENGSLTTSTKFLQIIRAHHNHQWIARCIGCWHNKPTSFLGKSKYSAHLAFKTHFMMTQVWKWKAPRAKKKYQNKKRSQTHRSRKTEKQYNENLIYLFCVFFLCCQFQFSFCYWTLKTICVNLLVHSKID